MYLYICGLHPLIKFLNSWSSGNYIHGHSPNYIHSLFNHTLLTGSWPDITFKPTAYSGHLLTPVWSPTQWSVQDSGWSGLTCSLGMHHSLGDPLPVEMGHLVKVHKVLKEYWTPGSSRHGVQLVIHWMTMAGCHDIRILRVGYIGGRVTADKLCLLCLQNELVCAQRRKSHACRKQVSHASLRSSRVLQIQ